MKKLALIIVLISMILIAGCNGIENSEAPPEITEAETTTIPPEIIDPISVELLPLGLTPEELLNILEELGLELDTDRPQSWDYIESALGDAAVQDGRIYQLHNMSFHFEAEGVYFSYSPGGIQEAMRVRTPRVRTESNLGIGSSFDDVVATYGMDFIEEHFTVRFFIEYFDGESYMHFSFAHDSNAVDGWGISTRSIFEDDRP